MSLDANNNFYSTYTCTFDEFVKDNKEWFEANISLSTPERSKKLQDALLARWRIYEICGETYGEFKYFMIDTLNVHKKYYEEMIDNYDKEFDYSVATIRKTKSKGNQKNVNVDLPNKKIDAIDIYSYPSSGDKTDSENEISYEHPDIFLTLKKQYMNQIRDLYREYAEKFSDCFIHIY